MANRRSQAACFRLRPSRNAASSARHAEDTPLLGCSAFYSTLADEQKTTQLIENKGRAVVLLDTQIGGGR